MTPACNSSVTCMCHQCHLCVTPVSHARVISVTFRGTSNFLNTFQQMKYAIIRGGGAKKASLRNTEDTKIIERIKTDARRGIMQEFRCEMTWQDKPSRVKRYNQIPRVCPMASSRHPNGNVISVDVFV